jgi:hypothetical protein
MHEELFKRMVFNILMDNTDDHERNQCVRLNFDGSMTWPRLLMCCPPCKTWGINHCQWGPMVLDQRLRMR